MQSIHSAPFEFHVSRQARDRYQFDQALFSQNGNVIFANFHAARVFAQKMNARRDLVSFPEQAVRAGQINAMGLIDEILHVVVNMYQREANPQAMSKALSYLYTTAGQEAVDSALRLFAEEFPPTSVYRREVSLDDYLEGQSTVAGLGQVSNRQIVLEELLLLWLANANPAFSPFLELFDDTHLEKNSAYPEIIARLHTFFENQPHYGPDNQNLIDMLRAPALSSPHSLSGQLEFIRTRWGTFLGRALYRLLSSLDLIREEEKVIFGVGGEAQTRIYEFAGLEVEPERFSPDREWMPNLVLMAKNSYVWLDQLSKKYKRTIQRLDEIPDSELDSLARWGITGLWLIGLWERSPASKRIKQLRGNPDAVASAYSLFSYDIAADLGGEEAYRGLRDRAWKRGIRLASDMVPNHMGIDSRWVIEHPDWFVALDYSPFPSYTFNGPNLSWDDRVGIFLEDHYYNNSDAAVVFKRRDNWTGSEKYIYHGNDGTSMPWNDTAQLNYLLPEVREAVIQTILQVARMFPVIRFDAAMTLAKKHYQRLWFPEPGSGGDIPSRAEFGMTKEQFDAAFPQEFWREVVDRVAQEVPDTLLLAEAFWLMEGYFVRTLGMHRVYNSAFMNMLRDEKNQEYRQLIKNTLDFDPEILKRYVNFMNNPDERTAVDQFGKGDKYFGIATLLSTMPGLPMFGHGQVEGYTEKYGMEFRRAYWDEKPDAWLVDRHEREIFPLLRRRYLFAEVRDFLLYDFYTPDGFVNENVFAYSNRAGEERALVLYHNKYASTRGWVRISTPYPVKSGDERRTVQKSLGEGLGLSNDPARFTIFRDQVTGLEYIRNSHELHEVGLYAELEAYKVHVFLDFHEVQENDWGQYGQLAALLAGHGVPSIDEALKELFLQPVHQPFTELVNAGSFRWLIENRYQAVDGQAEQPESAPKALDEVEDKAQKLFEEVIRLVGGQGDATALAAEVRDDVERLLALPSLPGRLPEDSDPELQDALDYLIHNEQHPLLDGGEPIVWGVLLSYAFTRKLGKALESAAEGEPGYAEQSRTWIDEWLLGKIIARTLQDLGLEEGKAWRAVALVKLLVAHDGWCGLEAPEKERAVTTLQSLLKDAEAQRYAGVNRFQGVLWYNQESFEDLLWWLYALSVAGVTERNAQPTPAAIEAVQETGSETQAIVDCYRMIQEILEAEEKSNFQLEKLLDALRS